MERFIKREQKVPPHAAYIREIRRAYLSEFNRFLDYVYGAIHIGSACPAAARLFDEIARVSLAHYEQLGQILCLMGEDAALNARIMQTSMRGKRAQELIPEAIRDEEAAAQYYKKLSRLAPLEAAKRTLDEIAKEKSGHVMALSGLAKRLERTSKMHNPPTVKGK